MHALVELSMRRVPDGLFQPSFLQIIELRFAEERLFLWPCQSANFKMDVLRAANLRAHVLLQLQQHELVKMLLEKGVIDSGIKAERVSLAL